MLLDLDLLREVSAYISDKFDQDSKCEANIILVSRLEIRQLNSQYREADKETDVLSFSYLTEKDRHDINDSILQNKEKHGFYTMGEIIICPAVASDNARSQESGWGIYLELSMLIIHGFLHMYGYDHEKKEEKCKMFDVQSSILEDVKKKFELYGK